MSRLPSAKGSNSQSTKTHLRIGHYHPSDLLYDIELCLAIKIDTQLKTDLTSLRMPSLSKD